MILTAYRAGDIGLEEAQAFALSDDHTSQERVFEQLGDWNVTPRAIRSALTEDEVPASDRRVRFIGLDAYEAAGGAVRRDLFDPQDGGYVQDTALLDRLCLEKLQSVAAGIRSEGWKWIEAYVEIDYAQLAAFGRVYPEDVPLSADDQARLETLTADYDEIADQLEGDPENADLADRLDQIDAAIDAINERGRAFSAEALSQAGAIVTLSYDGSVEIKRGLVLPEDARLAKAAAKSGSRVKPQGVVLSAKLIEDLSAQKTAAIAAELAQQPDVALAAVVHALALSALYEYAADRSCLQLRIAKPALRGVMADPEAASGIAYLDRDRADWSHRLPENPAALWTWCIAQTRDMLLDLLAFIAGSAVDAVQRKADREGCARLRHGNALAQALQFDMTAHFTPGADNVFGRISRDAILAALTEAKDAAPAPSWAKMKKAELAALAERQIAGTGWLPAPLRIDDAAEELAEDSADDEYSEDEDEIAQAAE